MTLFFIFNACPTFSFFNKINDGRANISNNGQRIGWNSKAQCFSNVYHLSLRKFMARMFFPTQINKASIPLMFGILCQRNPLKIFWSIVRFDSVNVINCKVWFISVYETHCNQTMNKNFWSFSVLQCRYNQISISIQKWRKFDRWKMAYKNLFNAVSDAFCRASSGLIPYASI